MVLTCRIVYVTASKGCPCVISCNLNTSNVHLLISSRTWRKQEYHNLLSLFPSLINKEELAHTAGAYPGYRSMKPTRSIATPPGWDASPLQVTPSNLSPVPIYTPGWRETLWELRVLPTNTTQWPRPALEPGPLDLETRPGFLWLIIFRAKKNSP